MMQAENRSTLIEASNQKHNVITAFRELDAFARSQFVQLGGQRMTMLDVLKHPRNERTDPLQVIVHPEMPWQASGWDLLNLRAAVAASQSRNEQAPHEIADCWRGIFQAEILHVLAGRDSSSVIIRDPHSTAASPIQGPPTVNSANVGTDRQSGFLPAQALTFLTERFGTITSETPVRIHGTSFGSCPTGTALQIAAAALYGTYFPDQRNEDGANRQRNILIQAMGHANVLRMETGIRMGTLLDYSGMHLLLEHHPEFAGIFRIFDDQTRIIPDRNAALMAGKDLRK